MKKRNGFTLIELLAVIVILGIIMMIAIPNVISTVEKQEKNTYVSDANKLITMAKYALRTNTDIPYPDPGQVVILYFSYIDNGDVETDPEGRTYDLEQSYVALKHTDDNYIEYNDDCYSCHIAFTKNMTLTSGGARKDVIDSTFYFVKYDGRWAIADMIATTK